MAHPKYFKKCSRWEGGIGSVGCHVYMKETEWLMQKLEVGNALDDEYDFDQQDMKVRNEERIEWTIQSEGLLEQRKEGKNKQTKYRMYWGNSQ